MDDVGYRHLRYFIAVAEELSFTKAAERMHTVQQSLSQQIRSLEQKLGTPLFRRDKHHVELTEPGRVFLSEARAIMSHTERAIALVRRAARGEAGLITIGFMPGSEGEVFSRVLPVVRTKFPEVELSLQSLSSPEQLTALENGEIDVGFLHGPIANPEIASEVILHETIVAVVPASHALARRKRIPICSLAALPFIRVSRQKAPAVHDIVNRLAVQAGVHIQAHLDTDSILATLNAVGEGMGFNLAPDHVWRIAPATVAVRPLDMDPAPEIDLLVAYRKDNRLPALPIFLSILRDRTLELTCAPSPWARVRRKAVVRASPGVR